MKKEIVYLKSDDLKLKGQLFIPRKHLVRCFTYATACRAAGQRIRMTAATPGWRRGLPKKDS
jgi:hypothetical protein